MKLREEVKPYVHIIVSTVIEDVRRPIRILMFIETVFSEGAETLRRPRSLEISRSYSVM